MWLPFRGDSERTIFDPYVSTGPVPSHLQPSIILKAYQSDYGRDAAMLNENELAEQSVKYYYSPFSPRFERSLFCPVETSEIDDSSGGWFMRILERRFQKMRLFFLEWKINIKKFWIV